MAEDKGNAGPALLVGGLGGGLAGAAVAAILMSKPAQAATQEVKLQYLIDLLEAIAEGQAQLITVLEQWFTGQVEVTVKTPWIAKDPEHIYDNAIRVVGTFLSDSMVDYTRGKRLLFMVQSSLNQAINIQLIGNYVDDTNRAVNIDGAVPCPANSSISIGLAWDDWHPFVGVRITNAVAPTAGILNIWAVIQE